MRSSLAVMSRLVARLGQSQRLAPLLYASIGGLAAGLGTVALVKSLDGTDRLLFNGVEPHLPFGRWSIVPIVALGGLLAGLVVRVLGHESRGHGVPDVMFAFEHGGGKMPWRVTLSGALATVATIGFGGSAGQEGPSVHIGAGVSSLVGSVLNLGQENRRLLVAVGAAGGISAVFNAPLTGSFFALEVVLRRFTVRNFSTVVLGAVLSNVVYRGIVGHESALRSPSYSLDSGWQVLTYVLLGVGTAIVAVAFVRGLYAVESATAKARLGVFAPAVGGALVGVLGVWHFTVIGTGTTEIASYLQSDSAARLLMLLVCLKLVATSLTLGSGGTGGVFMPSLFLGAAFGGAYGLAAASIVPGLAGPPGAYAVAGMAGVFAAAAAAPITSLLLAVEVSQDYGLIVPVMVVVVISTAVGQILMRETVYSEGLRRIGIDLSRERSFDQLEGVSVGSAYVPAAAQLSPSATLAEVRAEFERTGADILPVVEDRKVMGIISSRELLASLNMDSEEARARDMMSHPAVIARLDEAVQAAAIRMDQAEVRAVAVVDASGDFLGILDRAHVLGAYARAQPDSGDTERPLLRELGQPSGRFLRIRVRPGGRLANKAIRDVAFPEGSLIVGIRREGKMRVPRSSMIIRPGDQLVVLAEEDAAVELRRRGLTESSARRQPFVARLGSMVRGLDPRRR
ncbi:MAG: chloride channel protein [Tepidiformaceae bacterium]